MSQKPVLVMLSGKAASGKDSILKKIIELYPKYFHRNIAFTTRPKREGEIDGKDYHFISAEEMIDKVTTNQMLEVTEFNGWFYGTSFDSLSNEKINISIYNPEGAENVLSSEKLDCLLFYIWASDKQRLMRYLSREELPNIPEMIRRYGTDEKDFKEYFGYGKDTICAANSILIPNESQEDFIDAIDMISLTAATLFQSRGLTEIENNVRMRMGRDSEIKEI